MATFALFAFMLVISSYFGLIRNFGVNMFRHYLISKCSEANQADIRNGVLDLPDRYNIYDSVSYYAMLLKFWKPLRPEAWYKDTSFLQPTNKDNSHARD